MARPSFSQVLAQPNFFRLWLGQVISSVGDRFYQFALLKIVLVGTAYGQDTAQVVFFGMLPGLVFAPWIGWAVDRFERRALLIFTDIVRAVLALGLFAVFLLNADFHEGNMTLIFAIIFLMGWMNGLFIPARQAALPQLIGGKDLVTANALISMVGIIASMAASIIAVVLISIFNVNVTFVLTAVGFLASAVLIYRIDRPLLPQADPNVDKIRSSLNELLTGFRTVTSRPGLASLVVTRSVFAFVSGFFLIVVLEHTAKNVDLTLIEGVAASMVGGLTVLTDIVGLKAPVIGPDDIPFIGAGVLFGALGVGLGLGVWFCGKSKRWSHWNGLPLAGLFVLGAGTLAYAFLGTIGQALILTVGLGFLGAVIPIPIEAQLQNETSDEHRGRVFALANFGSTLAFMLALALHLNGALLADRGATQLVMDLGIGTMLAAALMAVTNRKRMRSFWVGRPPTEAVAEPEEAALRSGPKAP
ncbi:MAG: MFS transporter [Verrucomicrobiota bacterium]